MNLQEFLNKVAYGSTIPDPFGDGPDILVYKSKFDGSVLCLTKVRTATSLEEVADNIDNLDALPETLLFENDFTVVKCGRGEWTAQSLDDAKQMAMDYRDGVS